MAAMTTQKFAKLIEQNNACYLCYLCNLHRSTSVNTCELTLITVQHISTEHVPTESIVLLQ